MTDVNAGDLARVRALVQSEADLYQEGKVLFQAAGGAKDSPDIMSLLLCYNKMNEQYIEMIQPDGKTNVSYLLAEAQKKNHVSSVKTIKNHINLVVIREAEVGNLPRIQALMKLGGDIIDLKFKRDDGHTALMTAVKNKRIDVVNVLLSNGADLNQKNAEGKTARDLCNNDVRMTAILDKVGMVKKLRENIRKIGAKLKPEDIGSYLDKGVQVSRSHINFNNSNNGSSGNRNNENCTYNYNGNRNSKKIAAATATTTKSAATAATVTTTATTTAIQ